MKIGFKPFIFLLMTVIFSCKKDPKEANVNTGQEIIYSNDVNINLTNVCDNVVLQLAKDTAFYPGMPTYINANNDTFSVLKLRYYISNIKLKRPDGSYFVEMESYRLIDVQDTNSTCKIILKNVPLDNYISVELMLGVDSARNCSGAQTGALDPMSDMFWDWNQGYIFFKLEGYSWSAPDNFSHKNMAFHVGGFGYPYKNSRVITLTLPIALNVAGDHVSTIYMKANLLEAFKNPVNLDFSTYYLSTTPSGVVPLVNNYSDIFSVVAVK